MMNPFPGDIGGYELKDGSRDHTPLSVHFLALRVGVNLEEFKAVRKERL
jgi:hypothetical protein